MSTFRNAQIEYTSATFPNPLVPTGNVIIDGISFSGATLPGGIPSSIPWPDGTASGQTARILVAVEYFDTDNIQPALLVQATQSSVEPTLQQRSSDRR